MLCWRREDIENALEAVRMVQPPPRNFPRTDDDQFTAANTVNAEAGETRPLVRDCLLDGHFSPSWNRD